MQFIDSSIKQFIVVVVVVSVVIVSKNSLKNSLLAVFL